MEAGDNGPDMESIESPHEVGIVHACVHVQRLLLNPTLEQLLARLAIQAAAELQPITIFLQGLPPQWSSSLSILCCLQSDIAGSLKEASAENLFQAGQ